MINIPAEHLPAIEQILQKHIPGIEVRVFGSRITEKIKTYSDLDVVIMGKEKIDSKVLIKLKEEFEESDIPFRVDILDWHRISDEFKRVISKQHPQVLKK